MDYNECPLHGADQQSVSDALCQMSFLDLYFTCQDLMAELSPGERNTCNLNQYIHGYEDRQGYIDFIMALVKNEFIVPLQIPHSYHSETPLGRALERKDDYSWIVQLFPKEEKKEEQRALTDDLVIVQGKVEVTNPRWEHKDPDKKNNSPDKASFGDTLILMADIKNHPEGAAVTFDIYDMSQKPPQLVETAKGKHEKGVGRGEWKVVDKTGKGDDQEFAFEAIAKSKATDKKPIDTKTELVHIFSV
jgi:hypothetical protein